MKRIKCIFNKKYWILIIALIFLAIGVTQLVSKRKTITIFVDGNKSSIVTYKSTVGQVIKSKKINIGPKDKVTPSMDSSLSNMDNITIKRAVNVDVDVDGKELKILSAEDDVYSMLKSEGIELKACDKVIPEKSTLLSNGLKVNVIRVETKTIVEMINIPFKEVINRNSSLPNTKRKITQEGKEGEKKVTYLITYENGNEVSRKVTEETVVKEPQNRIIVLGTYPSMPVSRDGRTLNYERVFKARATAYWAVRGVGKTYTASGRKAVRNPDGYSTISVDPKVIPYGTRVFVEGYGFAIAADTGSAIKGNTIDVYFNTYKEACSWGVKYVKVYILK